MRLIFLFASALTITLNTFAQDVTTYKENDSFDLSIGVGSGDFSSALAWSHLHGIGKKQQRLKLGYGIRFTNYVGANKYFTTAPAKYTSTKQDATTIFSKTLDQNIDTLATSTASINSLNLDVYIQYTIAKKFDIGLNIDVIGVSFGPKKAFNVISSSYDPGQAPIQYASPTRLNLLLTSDNDIGSLNSEFYLKYAATTRWSFRLGLTFLFAEYRSMNELSFDDRRIINDRYRHKASLAMASVSFKPFAKRKF